MESGWNPWVWLVGVVSRRQVWLVGVVVRRYIDPRIITYPYSTCISSFFAAASLLLCCCSNVFSFLFVIFVQYSKRYSKNIRDHSTIEITQTWRYNYINKKVRRLRARQRVPRLPRARYRVTFQESCS